MSTNLEIGERSFQQLRDGSTLQAEAQSNGLFLLTISDVAGNIWKKPISFNPGEQHYLKGFEDDLNIFLHAMELYSLSEFLRLVDLEDHRRPF